MEGPAFNQARLEADESNLALLQARQGGLAVSSPTFVFRPGATGALAPNVFADWPSLFAAASKVAGPRVVEIDDSLAPGTATIPAGQWWFNGGSALAGPTGPLNVTLRGALFTPLAIATGASLGGVQCYERLAVTAAGTAGQKVNGSCIIDFRDATLSTGGTPFFNTGGASGVQINLWGISELGSTQCVTSTVGSTIAVFAYDNAIIVANAVQGGTQASITIASPNATVSATQAAGVTFVATYQENTSVTAPAAQAGALTGDLFNPAGPGVTFFPKSNNVRVRWRISGNCDAATRLMTFTLSTSAGAIAPLDGVTQASPGGDPAFTVAAGGDAIITALAATVLAGGSITVRVQWSASGGTFAPTIHGGLILEDMH